MFLMKLFYFISRDDFVQIDDVQDLATLLMNHISSAVSLSASVTLVIRRNKPWKSFIREMTSQKVNDAMDFEVMNFTVLRFITFYGIHNLNANYQLLL